MNIKIKRDDLEESVMVWYIPWRGIKSIYTNERGGKVYAKVRGKSGG